MEEKTDKKRVYASPVGEITLTADDTGLTGLWFGNDGIADCRAENESRALELTEKWLDIYFSGKEPDFTPPLHIRGTEFQKEVWDILLEIPYGTVMTYGEIADVLARRRALKRMSARAVGAAAGRNKIAVIIPCHRVVGSTGALTGYAGGIGIKAELLRMEGAARKGFFIPEKKK